MVLETLARCALSRSRRKSEAFEGSRRPSAAGVRALPAGAIRCGVVGSRVPRDRNRETLIQSDDRSTAMDWDWGANGTGMDGTPVTIGEHSRNNGIALRWECGHAGRVTLPSGAWCAVGRSPRARRNREN